jgi:hypothetical protein
VDLQTAAALGLEMKSISAFAAIGCSDAKQGTGGVDQVRALQLGRQRPDHVDAFDLLLAR